MQHVAVDLGGRESQICIRAADQTILEERRVPTQALPAFLAKMPPSRVILETGAESFSVADAALKAGHEVRVVPSILVRSLGVGARRMKTDRRDAQNLSEVSCRIDLPSVHIPSHRAREWKAMCSMRDVLVGSRTKIVNSIRSWLRCQLIRLPKACVSTLPKRVRERLPEVPAFVERQLQTLEQMNATVKAIDKDFAAIALADPICRRLMSVPGVGPQVAIRFLCTIDDLSRFESPHALQSYLGLTPGEDSSADRKRVTGITKAGNVRMRWLLVQAAWCAMRTRRGDPMVRWALTILDKKNKGTAIVALARKMSGVMFAIWRDGSEYEARKGAQSTAPAVKVYKMK